MKQLCIVAIFTLLPVIPLSFIIPNFMLSDSHCKPYRQHYHHEHRHHHHHHSRSSRRSYSTLTATIMTRGSADGGASLGSGDKSSGRRGRQQSTPDNLARLFEQPGGEGRRQSQRGHHSATSHQILQHLRLRSNTAVQSDNEYEDKGLDAEGQALVAVAHHHYQPSRPSSKSSRHRRLPRI